MCVCVGGGVVEGGGGGGWGRRTLRTALHTISLSLQGSFSESNNRKLASKKTLRSLNARWALHVHPVLRTKCHMGQAKNRSSQILH